MSKPGLKDPLSTPKLEAGRILALRARRKRVRVTGALPQRTTLIVRIISFSSDQISYLTVLYIYHHRLAVCRGSRLMTLCVGRSFNPLAVGRWR